MDDRERLARLKREVERALDGYLPPARTEPELLHRAMRYAVFSGGKRLRPIIMLTVGRALGVPRGRLMPAACAIELIHNFSLVHDDLPAMDDDDERRGKETCHRKFGEAVALLAGDALLALGCGILAERTPPGFAAEVCRAIGSQGMAGGQALDLLAQAGRLGPERKKRLDRMKTGRLFRVCFEAPFFFVAVRPDVRRRVTRLGGDFGPAFQIRDDLDDREGSPERLRMELRRLCARMRRDTAALGPAAAPLSVLVDLLAS